MSLIDYPGKIAAVIFCRGCNFRCPYCHNPELVDPTIYNPCLPETEVFDFLKTRKGKLDAVVITGGEPTLQTDLIRRMKEIRKLGFRVKLDTNGSQPDLLEKIIKNKLADYLAMDIKAPPEDYACLAGVKVDPSLIRRSLAAILQSGIPHEFRTTVISSRLSDDDILSIAREIRGAERYILQKYQAGHILEESYDKETGLSDEDFQRIKTRIGKTVKQIRMR